MFIKLTGNYSKGPILINLNNVRSIVSTLDNNGNYVTRFKFMDHDSYADVIEKFDEIEKMLPQSMLL